MPDQTLDAINALRQDVRDMRQEHQDWRKEVRETDKDLYKKVDLVTTMCNSTTQTVTNHIKYHALDRNERMGFIKLFIGALLTLMVSCSSGVGVAYLTVKYLPGKG